MGGCFGMLTFVLKKMWKPELRTYMRPLLLAELAC